MRAVHVSQNTKKKKNYFYSFFPVPTRSYPSCEKRTTPIKNWDTHPCKKLCYGPHECHLWDERWSLALCSRPWWGWWQCHIPQQWTTVTSIICIRPVINANSTTRQQWEQFLWVSNECSTYDDTPLILRNMVHKVFKCT